MAVAVALVCIAVVVLVIFFVYRRQSEQNGGYKQARTPTAFSNPLHALEEPVLPFTQEEDDGGYSDVNPSALSNPLYDMGTEPEYESMA